MRRPTARAREFRLWLAGTVGVGAVFGLWPGLDLWLAGLFFDPRAGAGAAGFSAANQPLVLAVYQAVPWLGRIGLLAGLLAWGWPAWRRRRARRASTGGAKAAVGVGHGAGASAGIGARAGAGTVAPASELDLASAASTRQRQRWRRRCVTLLALLVLGLWLMVNVVLKEGWGRPRPEHVSEFGGPKVFQPWWQPSRQCATNCSFVTGHGATGFALLGLGLLAPAERRRRWLVAAWAGGLGVGLVRMIQGGHFASDVLFACLVMWGTGIAIRRWLLVRRARRWSALA